jgi:hypothetical protein
MFLRANMHLSARSELKPELAESRIETKLPINQAGLLHVCLSIMQQGPLCAAGDMIKLTETREITPYLWVPG